MSRINLLRLIQPQGSRDTNFHTTMNESYPKGKILRGTEGIGGVTPEMLEERAQEIARADGRSDANDLDRTRARDDLIGSSVKPAIEEEPADDWYTPRGSSGEKASTLRPEDEENVPEKLVQEGSDEADHDQRSSSARTPEK
jgi:hypothetical protein